MAKVSGLPTSFTIDATDGSPVTFSNDAATLSLDISAAQQDVSGLDSEGTERIQLRGDWSAAITGFMGGDGVGDVFFDIRNARDVTIAYPGVTFVGVAVIGKFTPAVGADGSFGYSADIASSDGTFPTLS